MRHSKFNGRHLRVGTATVMGTWDEETVCLQSVCQLGRSVPRLEEVSI